MYDAIKSLAVRGAPAIGPMLLAKEKGINVKVFADETRPLLQGARLTSYELHKAGVKCFNPDLM